MVSFDYFVVGSFFPIENKRNLFNELQNNQLKLPVSWYVVNFKDQMNVEVPVQIKNIEYRWLLSTPF